MVKYPVKAEKGEVKAAGIGLPISTKRSIMVCKKINKLELEKAKNFLEDMISGKREIERKHFTKTCKEILKILESGEKNAKYSGMEYPLIKTICAEKGAKRLRMKRRRSFGSSIKNTNIKLILKEGKKKTKKEGAKK